MRKFTENISIKDDKGEEIFNTDVTVVLSFWLYPQVFVNIAYHKYPSVLEDYDGLCYPSLPTELQKDWIFKCWFSWKKYKERIIIPYLANLEYYGINGKFATEHYSSGVNGFDELLVS